MKFIDYLKGIGVEISLRGEDSLEVKTKAKTIEKEVLAQIKAYKPQIIAHLLSEKSRKKSQKNTIEDIYALSGPQQGILFHSLYDNEEEMYIEQICCELEGGIDVGILKESLANLSGKHSILRTSFAYESISQPVQKVYEQSEIPITVLDYSQYDDDEQLIDEFLREDRRKGFDLKHAPLMRVSIIKLNTDKHLFVLTGHHILLDGWSLMLFFQRIFTYYTAILDSQPIPDFESDDYKDYIEYIQRHDKNNSEVFWKDFLSDFKELPSFAIEKDHVKANNKPTQYDKYNFSFSKDITDDLQRHVKERGLTMNNTIQGIWAFLLARYTGLNNITFGITLANRPHAIKNIENRIGLYINTLPLGVSVDLDASFWELLETVNQQQLQVFDHQNTALTDIQDWIGKKELFNSLVVFENYPLQNFLDAQLPFTIQNIRVFERTNYDIALIVKQGETLDFEIQYKSSAHSKTQIEYLATHINELVQQVLTTPDLPLRGVEIVSEEEENVLFEQFHDNIEVAPIEECLHQLFERQVEENPHKNAIYFDGQVLTYEVLNQRANILAVELREKGVGANQLVGMTMKRSPEMIISILGILKAGGAYLPIDAKLPDDRIQYMLENSGISLLITDNFNLSFEKAINTDIEVFNITDFNWEGQNETVFPNASTPEDLVYALYTSGSTGRPKGVLLEHRNVTNLVDYCIQKTDLDFSRVLQYSTISFDVSFSEIFYTLCSGGELFLISEDVRNDLDVLFGFIKENQISTVFFPMSLLATIFNDSNLIASFPDCIRHIQTAGEQVVINNNFKHYLKRNKVYLHNHYGPSETHVSSTLKVDYNKKIPGLPSIGKPIQNCWNYIVNQHGKLQPIGIPGELWIGGEPVGRGYIAREDLTNEKFISNPFYPGGVIYKSGDLARWLPDGNIEFLGRIDRQIKIRGFRVEPAEVEYFLLNLLHVKEAVVHCYEDTVGDKHLCAYLVGDEKFDDESIRTTLKKVLPDYMIPNVFVQLDRIPLTPSKKIDFKALPVPTQQKRKDYQAPSNAKEKELISICSSILNLPESHISITDNFFELGGHSIKAMQLISRIRKQLKVKLNLSDVFTNPILADLSVKIQESKFNPVHSIKKTIPKTYYKTSSTQKRIFSLQELEPDSTAYNMPVAFIVKGKIDRKKLENTFQLLLDRHESLRTSFDIYDAEIIQKIAADLDFVLDFEKNTGLTKEEHIAQFIKPFNLRLAPLFRVKLIEFHPQEHLLLLDFHHIISDAFSVNTLIKDFSALYKGHPLQDLKLQYKDYAEWQYSESYIENTARQWAYWENQLKGELSYINLPYTSGKKGSGTSVFTIDEVLTEEIKQYILAKQATLNIFFQAIFNILLSKLAYQNKIILGTPMSGRRTEELEGIVGMFVNTVVLVNYPDSDKSFSTFLEEVKHSAIQAFEHQEYPFEELVRQVWDNRATHKNPLFNVMFECQNIDRLNLSIPDLDMEFFPIHQVSSKFDLTLEVQEVDGGISLGYRFLNQFFNESSIVDFNASFLSLIKQVLNQQDPLLKDLTIVDQKQSNAILMQLAQPILE